MIAALAEYHLAAKGGRNFKIDSISLTQKVLQPIHRASAKSRRASRLAGPLKMGIGPGAGVSPCLSGRSSKTQALPPKRRGGAPRFAGAPRSAPSHHRKIRGRLSPHRRAPGTRRHEDEPQEALPALSRGAPGGEAAARPQTCDWITSADAHGAASQCALEPSIDSASSFFSRRFSSSRPLSLRASETSSPPNLAFHL